MVAWEALDALSHQLELCKVSADTRLVVALDPQIDADRANLIRAAVARTGAQAIEVRMIDNRSGDHTNELLVAAANAADIVIATFPGLRDVGSSTDQLLLELPAIEPHAFPPHANLGRRVRNLNKLVSSSDVLRVSDTNGTNLSVALTGAVTSFDHGVLTARHRTAQFPAGWVSVVPASTTVEGELVLMPGDGNGSAHRLIHSPVMVRIIADHISAIEGDSADADMVRAQLEYADDPAAYGLAEITIGMNPGAASSGPFDDRLIDPVVSRLLAGIVTISFGNNLNADRPCNQQVAFALRDRSVTVDDLPVVVAGALDGDFAPDVYEL